MNKIQSSTQKWIQKDRKIWITSKPNFANPTADAFLEAKVIAIKPKEIIVNIRKADPDENVIFDSRQYAIVYEECQKLTYGNFDVSDMVDLQELNQPQLLFNLKRRYLNDSIFTYCGPTLVIINPYRFIDKVFNSNLLLEYQAYVFLDNLQYKTLPPHVYGLATFCLWQLFQNMRNQSIVISGESGAGKTQNTKHCLKFLASLGKNMKLIIGQKAFSKIIPAKYSRILNSKKDSRLLGIQDKILGCNEILQAFGNAKTIRNDNSSRFGKLILLLYGQTHIDIKSAFIMSYLLQKSRIVSVSQGQRNYHIFYYFVKGIDAERRQKYMLKDKITEYYYLNQSSVYDIKGVSDQDSFKQVSQDFKNYFSSQEIECIYKIISIVLNVGNLKFKKEFTQSNEETAIPINKEYLLNISKLLGVDYAAFQHCFQFKTRKMGVSIINSPLKYDEAIALQNSFSKNMYDKTFTYIVTKLNQKIQLQKINLEESSNAFRKSIGLLDIFGFQVLGINSLQQFFINFANEKLQQLYVSYIFKEEQNEFLKEGLKQFSHDIGFQDNKPVIDLFELYPLGLFHLINESSELNKPDEVLPDSIVKNHPKNSFVMIPKSKKGMFIINHSCSPVSYNTSGFTSRNKDEFPQQLLDVILKGNDQILIKIMVVDAKVTDNKNRTASKKFLGSKFLNQMNKLTEELYSSDCHFVRCIKPNSSKSPKLFNSDAVLQSLRYLGVLDSILIRKLGYIYRRPYKEFMKKFFEIEQYSYNYPKFVQRKTQEDYKEYSKNFLLKYASTTFASREILLGNKKILIKESALNQLQAMAKQKRKMRIQCANRIKRMYLSSVFRLQVKHFLKTIKIFKINMHFIIDQVRNKIRVKKAIKIQKYIKKYLLQKRLQKIKELATKSVTKISSYLKMKKQREKYLEIRQKAIKIQANIRYFLSMAQYLKERNCHQTAIFLFQQGWRKVENKKAVLIQKIWKGYLVRKRFKLIMEQIRKKLRLIKHREYLMKAIFHFRYLRFLANMNRYKRPIIKMQAILRGKFTRRVYILMKTSAIVIQRAFCRHLRKKYYLIRLWKNYRKYIYQDEKQKARELAKLNIEAMSNISVKYYPQTVVSKVKLYPQQLLFKYAKGESQSSNWLVNEAIPFNDKNTFQIYIGDFDIMGTQSYRSLWLSKYAFAKQEMKRKNEYPLYVDFNQEFTSIISNKEKMYLFYSNDAFNKETPNKIQINGTTQSMMLSANAGYLLKSDKKMYVWGSNYLNFIDQTAHSIIQYREVPQLTKLGISSAYGRQEKRYFIDQDGKTYHYTYQTQKYCWKLSPMNLPFKISIKTIAVSNHFSMFLGINGQIFAQGSNKKGQLGLGMTTKKQILQPKIIPFFQNNPKEIIECISVGMGHTVAKSKLGYVYSWGDNCFQQVSPKEIQYLHTPEILQTQQGKLKVLQAVAGARNTFILTQSLKVLGFGTSSSFPCQKSIYNYQLQLLKQTSNSKHLIEIKISVKWTQELSILFINAFDSNHCKAGTKSDVILKYAKMMAKEWLDDKVYPSYHQWTDNILNLSDLRKFKFANQNIPKAKNNNKQTEFQELKALMQLRKTSAVFKKAAIQKMQELLSRLITKKEEAWSQSDKQLHKYIQQNSKLLK